MLTNPVGRQTRFLGARLSLASTPATLSLRGPVTNDFCFQIRQTRALQRNAPVRIESANPPAATVNPVGALHAGKERKCSGGKRTYCLLRQPESSLEGTLSRLG